MKKSRLAEIAWAAGFFDGEGCFHTSKPYIRENPNHSPVVTIRAVITQAHPEVLVKFYEAVELGTVRGPYRRPGSMRWTWQEQSYTGVVELYELLYPYLGSVKREQGREAIERYQQRPSATRIR